MPDPAFPLVTTFLPATFRARGFAMPFTTPMLTGARVRLSRHAHIELVVPNPSGGRGTYVLQWSGVRDLCKPTLHDTMLFRRVLTLADIDPASIRDAALELAQQGYAGPEAASAAQTTMQNDHSRRLGAHFQVLAALTEQIDPFGAATFWLTERTPDFDRRASAALHRIAPSFGYSAGRLAEAAVEISDTFASIGIARDDRAARVPRLLARLSETAADLSRWLEQDPRNDIDGLGRTMANAIEAIGLTGAELLENTRLPLAEPWALLKRWCADPAAVRAHARRCDLLLDGYERVALLWLAARNRATRRAALMEMAPLMPELPREVLGWTDVRIPPACLEPVCRITSQEDAWRSGAAAYGLIERNESLRAMSI